MIKMLTLHSESTFAADAQYRIQSRLEVYGLHEDCIEIYGNPDSLLDALVIASDEGYDTVLAVEDERYNEVKARLIGRMLLETESSPEITEAISLLLSLEYMAEPVDLVSQSSVPKGSRVLLSNDGLYSGFGIPLIPRGNLLFMIPLDYSRVDGILDSLIINYFSKPDDRARADAKVIPAADPTAGYDHKPSVVQMTFALVRFDKRIAFSQNEATNTLLPLVSEVPGFSEVTYFVEDGQKRVYSDETEAQTDAVQRAKDAVARTFADYGAAVSDVVYTGYDKIYSAFIAVVNGDTVKLKKITTDRAEDLDLLLPHATSLLIETVIRQLEDYASTAAAVTAGGNEENEEEKKPDEEPVKKSMLAVAVLVALVAIGSAIFFVASYVGIGNTTTNTTVPSIIYQPTTSATDSTTDAIAIPATNDTGTGTTAYSMSLPTTDPNYSNPAEPSAGVIPASSTSAAVASEKGVFTFYVFGYGHGVGLSQSGAQYYAKQGWNYAEILTNYYYGTVLVIGDSYPATVTYAGAEYGTRDYLARALESEMGGSFHAEALKAQAIAIYTYARYYNFTVSSTGHAFNKTPSSACYAAVDAVLGYYLTYNGNPALTPFHAISAGKTTSYYNVWGTTALPYLSGGRPSYGDYDAKDFNTTYNISSEDFKSMVESNSNIKLTGDPSTWIEVISHDSAIDSNTGYIYSLKLGGEIVTGYKFRLDIMKGNIRSHCFRVVYTPNA